jgi:hypothetical protein
MCICIIAFKLHLRAGTYSLICSSHMDFEPEWDEKMIDMWDITENEYAVLSTYVANIGKNSSK